MFDLDLGQTAVRRSAETSLQLPESEQSATASQSADALSEISRDSHALFEACFAQCGIGMAVTSLGGHYLWVNRSFCDLLGYTLEEFRGMNFRWLTYPEDLELSLDRNSALLSGQCSNWIGEKRYLAKNGTPIWVQVSVSMISDGIGRPARFLTIVQDIRARKATEQALRESEERYRLLFDSNPCPTLVADIQTREILAVNRAAVRQYGFTEEELLQMRADQLRPDEDLPKLLDVIGKLQEGTHLSVKSRHRKKDGKYFDAEVVCRPMCFADRRAYFVAVTDLTERRRAERLECEQANLKLAVSAMEQVLGVVGHELRTPLAGLMAMSDFLLDPASQGCPERETFLRGINEEIQRMSNMVDDVLEAARLNSGRARWNWDRFDLEPVCREALETIRPLVDEKRIRLNMRFEPTGAGMLGDAGAVRRLILNLLSNARKHTTDGSIDLSIETETSHGQRWIKLGVSDTGGGIPPAILNRLGEAFALNSGVVGDSYVSGTGLGLAICKGIAEAHGGRISFQSRQGEGTRVTAILRADLQAPAAVTQKFFQSAQERTHPRAA